MMNLIRLRNTGSAETNLYYPRLMVTQHGEIVLATSKSEKYKSTTGILVGKTNDSTSTFEIGQKFNDWEATGPLKDYHGKVTITLENHV